MKCKHCGGNITLEMEYCPYCGKPNEHAQQHVRDMKQYQGTFERTRTGVQEAAQKYTGATVRVIVIAVLIILTVILLILGGKAYEFKRMWAESQAMRNSEKVMEEIDTYLENEEYVALALFYEEQCIHTYDTVFEKYTPVERASKGYRAVYESVMRIACPPTYSEQESDIEMLVENLEWFYRSVDMSEYEYYDGVNTKENRAALSSMEEKVELLLDTYCGLTKEEAQSMKELSKGKQTIMLEEAILSAE